jgi:glycosyltransferase involved in cell wall biosynthesis
MNHVVTVSDSDRRIVEELAPRTAVSVVPNGVDVNRIRPPDPTAGARPGERGPAAVFVGKMDYRPNVDGVRWFAEEILPLVRQKVPSFELRIVGRDPSPVVLALGTRAGVHVTGKVAVTTPFLHDASLAVIPLRAGSGSRLKVLEAMAAGTPVLSTTQGVEGLDVEAGRHVLVADGVEPFASAVVALLRDPDARSRLIRAGRQLVEDKYAWPGVVQRLAQVHAQVVERHAASGRG